MTSPYSPEKFFKELDHFVRLRETDKSNRKTVRKALFKLLTTVSQSYPQSSSAVLNYTCWPELFHSYFKTHKQMLPPTTIEQYIKLMAESIEDYEASQSLKLQSPQQSSSDNVLLAKKTTVKKDPETFQDFLKTHRIDAVNCLIGLTPSDSFITKYCPEMKQPPKNCGRQSLPPESIQQVSSTTANSTSSPDLLMTVTKKSSSSSGSRIKKSSKKESKKSMKKDSSLKRKKKSPSPSPVPSPMSSSPTSPSPIMLGQIGHMPSSSSSIIHHRDTIVPIVVAPNSVDVNKLTKREFAKLIQDWARIDNAALLQRTVRDFAWQLQETGDFLKPGDILIVRVGNTLVFGRAAESPSSNVVVVRLHPHETGGKSYRKRDVAVFPEAAAPLLLSMGSAKRLVDNPVEKFYRETVEGIKDVLLNHLEKNGGDKELLERIVYKKHVKLSEKDNVLKLRYLLSSLTSERPISPNSTSNKTATTGEVTELSKLCQQSEDLFKAGVRDLKNNNASAHPLLEEGMNSMSNINFNEIFMKKWEDYTSRTQESIEALQTERREVLSGRKKDKLSAWWLTAVEERVNQFLGNQGYDFSAVPEDYIDEPPKSLRNVLKNQEIIRRWIQPSTLEDKLQVKQLTKVFYF
eukprot:TRINITY_DN3902_c0_g1_i1.p1 TRINITY_DN3902_c0_g1~~TRINITY_DN3902_c0_g1_i1.p1  ORF type:complete len:632 (+),score=186.50 TRINITY_DN3902_c0_g1_i1:311-2206(+)